MSWQCMDVTGEGVALLLDCEVVAAAVRKREKCWQLWVGGSEREASVFGGAILHSESLDR